MELIRVEMVKGVQEGETSLSPTSPKGGTVSSPAISRKSLIMLGYGVMTAKAVFNTATQEIRAGGNEQLATTIENVATGVGIAVGAYATGGLSLVPLAISTGSQIYAREKNNNRVNQAREYEASMRGARVSYQQGGGYE